LDERHHCGGVGCSTRILIDAGAVLRRQVNRRRLPLADADVVDTVGCRPVADGVRIGPRAAELEINVEDVTDVRAGVETDTLRLRGRGVGAERPDMVAG